MTVDLPALLGAHVGSAPSTAIQAPPAPIASVEQAATGIAEPGHAPVETEPQPGPGPSDLWLALREDPARLGRLLDDLTRRLPFELVVTIDEGEDLLTLARSVIERERRRQALDMLLTLAESPARCKLVLLLRTEYFGQLAGLLPVRVGRSLWKEFYLEELSMTGMTDAVLGPTSRDEILYTDGIPYTKYGFSYEEGFAPHLVSEVAAEARARQFGVLSLLQVVCAMLYDQRVVQRRQDIIRAADLREIGGVRGALARYVGRRIDKLSLPSRARAGLRRLMQRLYTRHTDGRITRDLVPARAEGDVARRRADRAGGEHGGGPGRAVRDRSAAGRWPERPLREPRARFGGAGGPALADRRRRHRHQAQRRDRYPLDHDPAGNARRRADLLLHAHALCRRGRGAGQRA